MKPRPRARKTSRARPRMTRNQADTIKLSKRDSMTTLARRLWAAEEGQDIAEYAVFWWRTEKTLWICWRALSRGES